MGVLLFADKIKRALAVADEIGIYTPVVDAIDEPAKAFYERWIQCDQVRGQTLVFTAKITLTDARTHLPMSLRPCQGILIR